MAAVGSVSPISAGDGGSSSVELVRQALGLNSYEKSIKSSQGGDGGAADKNAKASATAGNVQAGGKSGQASGSADARGLDRQQQVEVQKLQATDRNVRAHEQAHMAAGGNLVTSGPTYEYRSGPDGNMYAVAGEVGIDSSPVKGDPEATISKEQRVRRAALAPADPSSQDQQVASAAAKMEMDARIELAQQKYNQGKSQQDVATTTKTVKA